MKVEPGVERQAWFCCVCWLLTAAVFGWCAGIDARLGFWRTMAVDVLICLLFSALGLVQLRDNLKPKTP